MPASSDRPSPAAEAVVSMMYCSSGTATKAMLWRYIDTHHTLHVAPVTQAGCTHRRVSVMAAW